MFWGVLNGVLIGILVYLRDGINISTWNHRSCNTNMQFFLKFHLENQHTYCLYSTRNPLTLFSYEVICITRQIDKVEQLPNPWNMENKSRQNVWLASSITSVDVHYTDTVSVTQLESPAQVSTITIENQLHFFEYFDDKLIYMKNFHLDFCKRFYLLINLLVFCTNAERFEWETIVQVFSAILNLVTGKQIKFVSRSPRS